MTTSPILMLLLVLGIIVLVPIMCRKIHIPSIVGFIVMGMIVGPYGFGLLSDNPALRALGQMGMLYIMFQSGVEIDINDFRQYRAKSILFGLFSFLFPFLLGIVTSRLLHFSWSTTILLSAMYGSHTLMTYPIVSRYGIQKTAAVNITVGGTILAISFSLLILACVKGAESNMMQWWMPICMGLSLVVILWLLPKVIRWIYKRSNDPIENFLIAMLALVFSAWLTEAVGLDGILGAFVCGVAMNGLIPSRSPMMSKINFLGSSFLVPLFLVSVGMMIDIRVFGSGWHILSIAGVMIISKLAGKWLASMAARYAFRLKPMEGQLIFGLTHATAAGTLAIVTIGYQMGLFNSEILNSAIIMILVLCTISSFVTEHASKQLALEKDELLQTERDEQRWRLVSIGNDQRESLGELCNLNGLHDSDMSFANDWSKAQQQIEQDSQATLLYHAYQPLNTVKRMLVAVPRYAEKEYDFVACFSQIRKLSSQVGAKVIFFTSDETRHALQYLCRREGKYLNAGYREMDDWEDVLSIAKEAEKNDLIVMLSARHSTASYNPLFEQIPNMLERFFAEHSYLIIYPEQGIDTTIRDTILTETAQHHRIWRLISKAKQTLANLILRYQMRD